MIMNITSAGKKIDLFDEIMQVIVAYSNRILMKLSNKHSRNPFLAR